jgi:hypothetical protein
MSSFNHGIAASQAGIVPAGPFNDLTISGEVHCWSARHDARPGDDLSLRYRAAFPSYLGDQRYVEASRFAFV